jgi:N-acetylmuramoyl-L-alanine amidase
MTMSTVVFDPGHGGDTELDGSAANNAKGPNGTLEKNITLPVAQKCGATLSAQGMNVLYTRDADYNVGLGDRARVALDAAAAAFVSIHFNASDESVKGSAQGTETYVHLTRYTNESARLGSCIQNALVSELRYRDREVLRGAYRVIRANLHSPNTAADLVECSFMDREDEEALLNGSAHQDRIARALANGISLYLSDPHAWGVKRYTPYIRGVMMKLRAFFLSTRDRDG